jgi:hypothetical protein
MMRAAATAGLLFLALSACTTEAPAPVIPDVALEPGDDGDVMPGDTTRGRDRRRMDIDQLAASIAQVSGGLHWTDDRGRDRLEQLSATLGKPDYAQNTQEDLEPSLLFEKFLGDAAASVCTELIEREASGGERVLMVRADFGHTWQANQAQIEENLSHALLRFHGRTVAPESAALEPWTWLYRTTHEVTGDPQQTWRTVCVALLTHPDFYTY